MSQLDYLETLSNLELHAECKKYNLPNVPVTDTSRKLLLRRLRAVIDGVPIASPTSKRRETVNNTGKTQKKPQDKSPRATLKSATNRRTTQQFISEKDSNDNVDVVNITSQHARTNDAKLYAEQIRRKDTASTSARKNSNTQYIAPMNYFDLPAPQDEQRRSRSVSLSKTDVLTTSYKQELPHQDELARDYSTTNLYDRNRNSSFESPYAHHAENARAYDYKIADLSLEIPRSRSVSLSKSGVTTTSYRQETTPLREFREEDDEEEPMDEDVDEVEAAEEIISPTSYAVRNQILTKRSEAPPLYASPSYTPSPYIGSLSTQERHSAYKPLPYAPKSPQTSFANTLNSTRYSTSPQTSTTNPTLYPSLAGFTTNSYANNANAIYNNVTLEDANDTDDEELPSEAVENIMDSSDEEDKLPYSPNWQQHKVSPFTSGGSKLTRRHDYSGPTRRRTIQQIGDGDEVKESLCQFLEALERKYHLKQTFAIILIFLCTIFVYVFFVADTNPKTSII